jgi:hypothetical protein
MNNMQLWIKHLRHPLVFAGFGLFLFALIIKPLFLNITNLSGAETEQLLRLAMLLLFILAATAVAGGIFLSRRNSGPDHDAARQDSSGESADRTVEQETKGVKSAVINNGRNARLNYGRPASAAHKAAQAAEANPAAAQTLPSRVKQTTCGKKSAAVNAQGDAEVNYAD